jgi:hypothetical protein
MRKLEKQNTNTHKILIGKWRKSFVIGIANMIKLKNVTKLKSESKSVFVSCEISENVIFSISKGINL